VDVGLVVNVVGLARHRLGGWRRLSMSAHRVVVLAGVVGAVTGLAVAAFEWLVVEVLFDRLVDLPPWMLAFLPGAGLLVALAARRIIGAGASPSTADEYLRAFHDPDARLGWRAFAGRIVAAVATLGSGAPMGLEGPSLYIGATFGSNVERRAGSRWAGMERRTLTVAGAAAGVAAIFKAPATGAVFALEVPYRGDFARRMLLPALVASATGYLVFAWINGTDPIFPIEGNAAFGFRDLAGAVVVGAVAAAGAHAFSWLLRHAKRIPAGPHPMWTTIAAGLVIAGLFAIGEAVSGEPLVVGSGYELLVWVGDPSRSAWVILALLVLRGLATSATVAGGGVGGLFIPLVVAGALTGALVGHVVNSGDLDLFIVIGVAAFLGAGYRVPLAAVMFVAETTGRPSFVVPGLIAAVAAELLMGRASVTEYQLDHTAPAG
jgi:CIC family chloride channel protein